MISKDKKRKYKLAILTSHPIQYYAPLYKKLATDSKIELTVYYCSEHGVTEKWDSGFGVAFKWNIPLLEGYSYKFLQNISPWPGPQRILGLINPGIMGELSRWHYDAVIIQGYTIPTNLLAYLAAWITSTPVIFRGETQNFFNKRVWLRAVKRGALNLLFARTRAFLPIGKASLKFYSGFGVPEEKLFLTPYSVDNAYFCEGRELYQDKKNGIKSQFGLSDDKVVILFSGKLIQRKRPLDLLKAFEKISERKGAELIFMGDGEQKAMLSQYCRGNKIKEVSFLGFINQDELRQIYALADIFVLPSEFETWGLVINEAMCYGVPIITTNMVGASFDLVRNGENGFLYSPGDINMLADILAKLLTDERLRSKMGKRSLEIISSWNYETCVRSIVSALDYIKDSDRPKEGQ